jgi:hypothetical protein
MVPGGSIEVDDMVDEDVVDVRGSWVNISTIVGFDSRCSSSAFVIFKTKSKLVSTRAEFLSD